MNTKSFFGLIKCYYGNGMLVRSGAECSHREVGEDKFWTLEISSIVHSVPVKLLSQCGNLGVPDLAILKLMHNINTCPTFLWFCQKRFAYPVYTIPIAFCNNSGL